MACGIHQHEIILLSIALAFSQSYPMLDLWFPPADRRISFYYQDILCTRIRSLPNFLAFELCCRPAIHVIKIQDIYRAFCHGVFPPQPTAKYLFTRPILDCHRLHPPVTHAILQILTASPHPTSTVRQRHPQSTPSTTSSTVVLTSHAPHPRKYCLPQPDHAHWHNELLSIQFPNLSGLDGKAFSSVTQKSMLYPLLRNRFADDERK